MTSLNNLPLGALKQCIFGALKVYSSTMIKTISGAKIPGVNNIEERRPNLISALNINVPGINITHDEFNTEIGYNIHPFYRINKLGSTRGFSTTYDHKLIVDKYDICYNKDYDKKMINCSKEILKRIQEHF
jgi:hypothetical protein